MEQRSRPSRVAAQNAVYRPCPSCNRKFLITEIEMHANLCLLKQEKTEQKGKTSTSTGNSPRKTNLRNSQTSQDQNNKSSENWNNIPEAPTFYPTKEEFSNPLQYIKSIKNIAQPYGICKIIPPSSPNIWLNQNTFETNVNPDTFIFQTKVQNVREISRRGFSDSFLESLEKFMSTKNNGLSSMNFNPCPQFKCFKIQLLKLFKVVVIRGGFDQVDDQGWKEIIELFDVPVDDQSIDAFKNIYKENLFLFEKENKQIVAEIQSKNQPQNNPQNNQQNNSISSSNSSSSLSTDSSDSPAKEGGGGGGGVGGVMHIGMRAVKLDPNLKEFLNTPINSSSENLLNNSSYKNNLRKKYLNNNNNNKNNNNNNDNNEDDSENEEEEEEEEEDEFGFAQGKVYSLSGFKKQANRFARRWFNISAGEPFSYTEDHAEKEFWHLVEKAKNNCYVQYGSDLDVQSHGSGFSYESNSNWNLNILPTLSQSLLRYLSEHVAGITVPMMYVGMLFSCFCWHTEDNYLYSINYLHTGATKIWYGVGSNYAELFERVFQRTFPDYFEKQPDLLHHLTTMICPKFLLENGVPIVRLHQRPGEFVITFPQAYHAGFNSGYNVAEAVNFATVDWIEFCDLCVENYRKVQRSAVFSHHELIYNALLQEENFEILSELYKEFQKIVVGEQQNINNLLSIGINKIVKWDVGAKPPHSKPCSVCNCECYYVAVSCPCNPQNISCPLHYQQLCGHCELQDKYILRRYAPEYIDAIHNRTKNRLNKFCPTDKKRLKEFETKSSPPKRNCIEA